MYIVDDQKMGNILLNQSVGRTTNVHVCGLSCNKTEIKTVVRAYSRYIILYNSSIVHNEPIKVPTNNLLLMPKRELVPLGCFSIMRPNLPLGRFNKTTDDEMQKSTGRASTQSKSE